MKTLFAAAIAVSLLTGTVTTAYADNDRDRGRHSDRGHRDHDGDKRWHRDHDRRDHRGHDRRDDHRRDDHRRYDRDHRQYNHDRHGWDRRDAYRAGYRDGRVDQRRYHRGRYIAPRGYHQRHWRHGDHLPRAYYSGSYVVHDYHAYHLHRPPHGHHWVRVDNDVVLAAVASGLVVSVVSGLFY
jgi:Ni/Co efflux regulator RcnB